MNPRHPLNNVVIAPNYFDRKDKENRWLYHPSSVDGGLSENIQRVGGLVAFNVHFAQSTLEAQSFGCGTSAYAEKTDDLPDTLPENLEVLIFNGWRFVDSHGRDVFAARVMYLLPNGRILCQDPVRAWEDLQKIREQFSRDLATPKNPEVWDGVSERRSGQDRRSQVRAATPGGRRAEISDDGREVVSAGGTD